MSLYLVLEGPDGGGKSSQAERLAAALGRRGVRTVHLREPGSTPVGEALRRVLLDPSSGALGPLTEALLFTAARAEMVRRLVAPALAEGTVVLAERCYLSTMVYQGFAPEDGVDLEFLEAATERAVGDCRPDRIFMLYVSAEVAAARRQRRTEDRIEGRGGEYLERVHCGFLELGARDPRVVRIDAARTIDEVHADLLSEVNELLEARR